jgi:hypothetical protein
MTSRRVLFLLFARWDSVPLPDPSPPRPRLLKSSKRSPTLPPRRPRTRRRTPSRGTGCRPRRKRTRTIVPDVATLDSLPFLAPSFPLSVTSLLDVYPVFNPFMPVRTQFSLLSSLAPLPTAFNPLQAFPSPIIDGSSPSGSVHTIPRPS